MTQKLKNAYKTIGEVAKVLDLYNKKTGSFSTYTIRFWEKEFKQIKPKVFNGNRRYYDEETIIILKKIKFLLKVKGMTLNGVKKLLNSDGACLSIYQCCITINHFAANITRREGIIANPRYRSYLSSGTGQETFTH